MKVYLATVEHVGPTSKRPLTLRVWRLAASADDARRILEADHARYRALGIDARIVNGPEPATSSTSSVSRSAAP